jgi:UDP-N-acetylglucosamine:LPS N-acetylglucosamine transferase
VLGGWVSLPALLTGFFGRPSVLIEQNARPGKVSSSSGGAASTSPA